VRAAIAPRRLPEPRGQPRPADATCRLRVPSPLGSGRRNDSTRRGSVMPRGAIPATRSASIFRNHAMTRFQLGIVGDANNGDAMERHRALSTGYGSGGPAVMPIRPGLAGRSLTLSFTREVVLNGDAKELERIRAALERIVNSPVGTMPREVWESCLQAGVSPLDCPNHSNRIAS
jgi:hypothetical protein